jgi:hypothetical protein
LVENIESAQSALSNVESELRYVNDELEEKEDIVNEYEVIGDVDEVQEMHDDLGLYTEIGTVAEFEALKSSESVENLKAANELLTTINKQQVDMIRAARLGLITDEDTGLTPSQADYMQYLRDGEPQDVVLARGVELKVNDLIDSERGVCLCPPSVDVTPEEDKRDGPVGGPIVGWDANGSPVFDE